MLSTSGIHFPGDDAMAAQPLHSKAPKFFNSVATLTDELDRDAPGSAKVPNRFPRCRRPLPLDNWARKWREGTVSARREPRRRRGAGLHWAMVIALCALATLIPIACGTAVLALSGFPEETQKSAMEVVAPSLAPVIDPALEMQAVAEGLMIPPDGEAKPGRVPHIIAAPDQAPPADACFNTRVHFVETPAKAARLAERDQRLMLVLNISGEFEDSRFT
jgi:hypothetical protein